jgi:cytochrome c-type biogenesis protein CcmF
VELLGRGALILALLFAVFAAGAGWWAGVHRDRRVATAAARAILAAFAAVLTASVVMWVAILRHDFRFEQVADHSSRSLPTPYLFSSFWSSQAGSLLLWGLILTGLSSLAVWLGRTRDADLLPWLAAILGGISTFFLFMLVAVASPFETVSTVPADGSGLNTSLQNPYMMAHPPVLYLGYVGFAIPFAYAMAALLAGRTDERWILTTRRFTLAAWGFLGIGIVLGAKWAYESVGWGGFWGWDPVENAALIPWLVGTAFLHSVIVQEKKGMLKVWNVCLVSATFALSILGTFLTRSAITSSIHSFVQSNVGPWFVAFIGIIVVFASGVILTHLPLLRARHRIESVVSREATFLFNNLLFVALAFAILWGVLFPILSQAVRGQQFSVSSPYYDFFAAAFGIPLIFLAGFGPVVAWRKASKGSLAKAFRWPFLSAACGAALCVFAGLGSSVPGVIALSLCLFVVVCISLELARGTVARHALDPGRGWPSAFTSLIGRNRRRYGGYVVHLGVVVGIVGIIGTTVYATVSEQIVQPGQTLHVHGYAVTFKGIERHLGPNYSESGAVLSVRHNGGAPFRIDPSRRFFDVEGQTANQVAIRTDWRTGSDLYVIFSGTAPNGGASLKVLVNPVVDLLWLGGLLIGLGTLVAIWPDPHVARRLARRYAEEPVSAETT